MAEMGMDAEALVFFGAIVNGVETEDGDLEFEAPSSWDGEHWEDVVATRFGRPPIPLIEGEKDWEYGMQVPPGLRDYYNKVKEWEDKQNVSLIQFGYLGWQDEKLAVLLTHTLQLVEWGCESLNTRPMLDLYRDQAEWEKEIRGWAEKMDLHIVGEVGWKLAARYG